MNIGNKIIISFSSIGILCVVFLASTSFYFSNKAIKDRIESQLESVSTLKENQLVFFLEEREAQIVDLSRQVGTVLTSASEEIPENDTLKAIFINEAEIWNQSFKEFFFVDVNGVVIVSSESSRKGKIISREDFFIKGKRGPYKEHFYYDPGTQNTDLTISAPVLDERDHLLGVVVGKVTLDAVSDFMEERSGLGDTGETYLVGRFGTILTRPLFAAEDFFGRRLSGDHIDDCISGNRGFGQYKNYSGSDVLSAYRWIEERQVCLIAEIGKGEAFSTTTQLRDVIFIVSFLLLLLIVVLSLIVSQRLTSPINQLIMAVEKFGEGNLKKKILIKSKDEIGELSQAFNKMYSQLDKAKNELRKNSENLENMVEKRTSELEERVGELELFNQLTIDREVRMAEIKKELQQKERGKKKK